MCTKNQILNTSFTLTLNMIRLPWLNAEKATSWFISPHWGASAAPLKLKKNTEIYADWSACATADSLIANSVAGKDSFITC